MPYELVKKGQKGYVVKNTQTGHEHSNKPIPKERATAQMRLLYGIEQGLRAFPKRKKEDKK